MATEIANCPIDNGTCFCKRDEGYETWYVACHTCCYTYQPNSEVNAERASIIAAHNALCADVQLARNLRKAANFGIHIAHEIGGGRERWLIASRSGTDTGGTLDAALAQLAEKIQGDT